MEDGLDQVFSKAKLEDPTTLLVPIYTSSQQVVTQLLEQLKRPVLSRPFLHSHCNEHKPKCKFLLVSGKEPTSTLGPDARIDGLTDSIRNLAILSGLEPPQISQSAWTLPHTSRRGNSSSRAALPSSHWTGKSCRFGTADQASSQRNGRKQRRSAHHNLSLFFLLLLA